MSNRRPFVTSSRIANVVRVATLPILAFVSSAVAWAGDSGMPLTADRVTLEVASRRVSTSYGVGAVRAQLRDTARQLCADVISSLGVSAAQSPTTCIDEVLATALRNFDSTRGSEDGFRGHTRDTTQASRQPRKVDPNTATMKVSLADLDLSTAEGNQVAHKRLRRVAERLCSRVSEELDLGRQQHVAACVERTMTDVQPQITANQLAARSTR